MFSTTLTQLQRFANGITDASGKLKISRSTRTRILGEGRLRLIWTEMQEIMLPSEVSPAPSRIGSPGQGTISADEWRTFCTINLVVTLVYLWGPLPDDSRESQILRNFMDLITAVEIASSRSITLKDTWELQKRMRAYLQGILELFPGTTIGPYQHMCLGHLPQVLLNLGPSHAIWCYAFERANYVLQRIKTNSRIGRQAYPTQCSNLLIQLTVDDLSVTLLRRFCCRQNLHALFTQLPARLKRFAHSFKRVFESNSMRGTLFSDLQSVDDELRNILDPGNTTEDLHPGKPYHLSPETYEALRTRDSRANRYVTSLPTFDYEGVRFRPHSLGPKDSHVVFRESDGADWRAGRIREMFTQEQGPSDVSKIWIVVDEYIPLSTEDQALDPYRKFPIAGGRMFYAEFKPEPLVLAPEEIVCHSTMMKRQLPVTLTECVHILPLDKALCLLR